MGVGDHRAAALAIYSIRQYVPAGDAASSERAVERAVAWLKRARPTNTQDRAFHLLGLVWGGEDPDAAAISALEALQHTNGGWSQLPNMDPDAYATEIVLYALHMGARRTMTHPTYRKGIDFLLSTQADDGTCHVKTRAIWLQPYFESGFPYGRDQFVSTAGTAWAAMALATAKIGPGVRASAQYSSTEREPARLGVLAVPGLGILPAAPSGRATRSAGFCVKLLPPERFAHAAVCRGMKQEFEDHHESLSGSKAVEQIRAVAKAAHICLFGTAVTRVPLTVRPMAVQSVDDTGALWFLSDRRSHTNREVAADPRVQLLFSNPGDSQYLTLQGTAMISDDPALKQEHWTPLAKTWFNGGVDDPDLTVVRVEPSDGYYWDTKHGKMYSLLKAAAGAVAGKTIDDSIEGQVRP